LVTDVPPDPAHLVEGGILQRIYLYQQSLFPESRGNTLQIKNKGDSEKSQTATPKKEKTS